jgi:hypothetical protein
MLLRSIIAATVALCLFPDEGQWLPTQVRDFDWPTLQKRGMALTKDEFFHPTKGGVLSATVQINGCTASFVSSDGLLITNHHCGFDAISQLSSPEHNWLRDGFVANERTTEMPAAGVVASVLKRIEDVTAVIHKAQDAAKSNLSRWDITQQTIAKLVSDAQAKEPNTVCTVASFLEGKEYQLYYRTQLTDVRLAYAPPRAIGEFGGETDNWEWPRHTGDFSIFRVYAAPDGTPRAHHKDNVAYHPEHFLKTCKDGVQPGDLAIIMGYPGNTQRYKSSRAVQTRQGYVYPRREAVLAAVIKVIEQAAKQGEQRALDLAPSIKQLANVQKNASGMVFGLARNAVVERKMREETQLREWLQQSPDRQQKFGHVLDDLLAMDEDEAANVERDFAISFVVNLISNAPLLQVLMDACFAVLTTSNGALPLRLQKAIASDTPMAEFNSLQQPILAVLLAELATVKPQQRLRGTEVLLGADGIAILSGLLAQTKMTDSKARTALFIGGAEAVENSTDNMIILARGLAAERRDYQLRSRERQGQNLLVGRRWIEAQEAFRGKQFYPDANSTLRVAIATIKGYSPRDGMTNLPQTTVAGLLQKETGKEPFANPKTLLAAAATRSTSRWFDARIGDVPVCFLCDGDTTGGNSGSPVINGKGELIGLNFDRVFENVAGDFGWNEERSRNVVCDFRYILWVMECVLSAPALLKELGA